MSDYIILIHPVLLNFLMWALDQQCQGLNFPFSKSLLWKNHVCLSSQTVPIPQPSNCACPYPRAQQPSSAGGVWATALYTHHCRAIPCLKITLQVPPSFRFLSIILLMLSTCSSLHEGEGAKGWMEVMKERGERNLIWFKLFARFLLRIFEPTRKEYLGSFSFSFNHKRVFILEK